MSESSINTIRNIINSEAGFCDKLIDSQKQRDSRRQSQGGIKFLGEALAIAASQNINYAEQSEKVGGLESFR